jgi:hypothetical protein
MTNLTPTQLVQRLIDLERRLDALVAEYRDLSEAAAEAKREYEVAYSKAYMSAEGPVEERKQRTIADTSDLRFLADLGERKVAACREAIRAQHAHIEVARTLSATTRDEMRLAGSGVHA